MDSGASSGGMGGMPRLGESMQFLQWVPAPLMNDLIDNMVWLQHNAELGECSARLIESIWEDNATVDENSIPQVSWP